MKSEINKAQFEGVLRLPGPKRYKHFISRVADWAQVFSLKNDEGFVTMADDEGHTLVPLWPHQDYASAMSDGEWVGCGPTGIDLESFIEKWIPGIETKGWLVAVFPTPDERGVVVPPERLLADLKVELERIE